MNKAEKHIRQLERDYKTLDVIYRFTRTTREDFDSEIIKKYSIKAKECKYLLDVLSLNLRSKIQYGSQFNYRLTTNHIWSYYDEIQRECYSYVVDIVGADFLNN